jgi:hypothetical protein
VSGVSAQGQTGTSGLTAPQVSAAPTTASGAIAGASGGAGTSGVAGTVPVGGTAPGGTTSSGSGASGVNGSAAPAAPGATGAHGPVKVGFVVSNFTKTAAAFGFGAASDPEQWFKYLVKSYNDHGGLAGRKIDPVYSEIDGSSADWSTASQAACAQLTQDNHVELVLSNLWVNGTLTSCLLKAGVPQFEGTAETLNDEHMLAQTPNLFIPAGLSTDREGAAVVNESVRIGQLTTKDKLGILYDGCSYSVRGVSEGAIPAAKRNGIPYVSINAYNCGGGFADVGAFTSGVQSAELKLHSEGVTKVMFITQGENGALTFFSDDAESQHWNPTYLVSSNVVITYLESQGTMQKDQMVNVHGIGWTPGADADNAATTPLMRTCLQDTKAGGGAAPTNLSDTLTMYAACNAMAVSDTALRASGGVGGLAALQSALEGLGTSFTSIATIDGRTRFGPGRHDGADEVAPFGWVSKCNCFQYVGQPRQIS